MKRAAALLSCTLGSGFGIIVRMSVARGFLIGAGLLAVIFILRWLLHRILRTAFRVRSTEPNLRQRVLLRFERLGFYQWMFALLKTRLDSMFDELPALVSPDQPLRNFLDLGCGFGIAGSFLLEMFPTAQAIGIDPSIARVQGAQAAFGNRGRAFRGAAPDFLLTELPEKLDAIFILDVIHFLSDPQLKITLKHARTRLDAAGRLVIRANIQPTGRGSLLWNCYAFYRIITGVPGYFRSVAETGNLISGAGFEVMQDCISGENPELHWYVCRPV